MSNEINPCGLFTTIAKSQSPDPNRIEWHRMGSTMIQPSDCIVGPPTESTHREFDWRVGGYSANFRAISFAGRTKFGRDIASAFGRARSMRRISSAFCSTRFLGSNESEVSEPSLPSGGTAGRAPANRSASLCGSASTALRGSHAPGFINPGPVTGWKTVDPIETAGKASFLSPSPNRSGRSSKPGREVR